MCVLQLAKRLNKMRLLKFPTLFTIGFLFITLVSMTSIEEHAYLSNQQAKEEIQMVVANILRYHPDPFHVTPKEEFHRVIDELLERKGNVPIGQHFFDLSRISSMIYDTHTQLYTTDKTLGLEVTFPLRFRIFPDGVYIIAGSEDYRDAIGKKVLSISGHATDDVIELLSNYSAADNTPRRKVFAEMFLYLPETYEVFNLKTPEGKIELELEGLNGEKSNLILSKTWKKSMAEFSNDAQFPFLPKALITVHDIMGTPVPFYLKNVDNDYWWTFLDDDQKYQYIQINKQYGDKEEKPSPEFHLEWMEGFWNSNVEVLIIDLRNDPGGTIQLTDAIPGFLSYAIYVHPTLKSITTLIGPDVVSAGTVLASRLEYSVHPVMIGSPTGSSPNMFLSAYKFELPHSKIIFEVSQSQFISSNKDDSRAYIAPDIPMEMSFKDYANGHDALLEFAKTVDGNLRAEIYKDITLRTIWKRATQREAIR